MCISIRNASNVPIAIWHSSTEAAIKFICERIRARNHTRAVRAMNAFQRHHIVKNTSIECTPMCDRSSVIFVRNVSSSSVRCRSTWPVTPAASYRIHAANATSHSLPSATGRHILNAYICGRKNSTAQFALRNSTAKQSSRITCKCTWAPNRIFAMNAECNFVRPRRFMRIARVYMAASYRISVTFVRSNLLPKRSCRCIWSSIPGWNQMRAASVTSDIIRMAN